MEIKMKLPKGYTKWDAADYLKSEQDIEYFLEDAFEDNDPEYIARALGVVARARGMSKVAKKAGITRAALYQSLSKNGNPTLSTIIGVINALGLKLRVVH